MTTTTHHQRGAALSPNNPAVPLANRVHGFLMSCSALFALDPGFMGVDQPAPSAAHDALVRILAEELLQYADCDSKAYAGMLIRDHIEAWENDGVGTTVPELASILDELITQKPHRHFRVTLAWDTGRGTETEDRQFAGNGNGRVALIAVMTELADRMLDRELETVSISMAAGRVL